MSNQTQTITAEETSVSIEDLLGPLPGTTGQPTDIFGLEADCPSSKLHK